MSPLSLTCSLTQYNAEKIVKHLFGGEKDVEVVLQRLDRLTLDEARTTGAEILKVVYGLVQDMSKQTNCACLSLTIERPSRQMGKHLVALSAKFLVRFVGTIELVLCLTER